MRGKSGLALFILLIVVLLVVWLTASNMKRITGATVESIPGDDPVTQAQDVVNTLNDRMSQFDEMP